MAKRKSTKGRKKRTRSQRDLVRFVAAFTASESEGEE